MAETIKFPYLAAKFVLNTYFLTLVLDVFHSEGASRVDDHYSAGVLGPTPQLLCVFVLLPHELAHDRSRAVLERSRHGEPSTHNVAFCR